MQNKVESPQPLTLPPQDGGWRQTLWSFLATLMFGAIVVALAIYTVPTLVSDWQVRETAVPVAGGRVTQGSCSSKLFINICDATLSARTKTGDVSRSVNYIFVDVHSGSYSLIVLADPAHPELLTADIAIEKLWNRTITLLVIGGILLALALAPFVGLVRRLRRS